MLGRGCRMTGLIYVSFGGFGPSGPNIRNSCPELRKADVFDVPGFMSCQVCLECRGVLMPIDESFFWKFLKMRGFSRNGQESGVAGAVQMSRELEGRYRVEAARPGDRVCYLNLDHPTVPNWLWVNELMLTEFGVRVPFTDFQQRLLNRASIAPSQLHPNAWGGSRRTGVGMPACIMSRLPIKGLNTDQKDTADILVKLFSKRKLKPKTVLSNPSEAREAIVDMAGNEVTLERLHRLIRPGSSQTAPVVFVPAPGSSKLPAEPQSVSASGDVAFPEGGGSSNVGSAEGPTHEVSSPVQDETLPSSPSSPHVRLGKRPADDVIVEPMRPRVSEGTNREFCSMDRSFDASGFIASNLLGPRAQEVLRDYDPMKSIRWAEWASLRSATIMKSIEPRLMAADQWESRCVKLNGNLKALNLQRIEAEKKKWVAEQARVKAEGDLKFLSGKLEALEKEKVQEAERRKDWEAELDQEIQDLRKSISEQKARADKAEASLAESEKGREELVRIAEDSVVATERALKDQVSLLLPEFDVSQLGAFKVIVDGKIVDLPE
ncbi:hypothetical protein PIB30_098151 [Stylosanthes scabra]|uniref:Uncharacterized protein n=1 Tax=Stylosanthes scabra TaxID=79078 RepID=A0ABU6UVE4_9FABA|nr:hypothetical protein [Stylosanthes scabra]